MIMIKHFFLLPFLLLFFMMVSGQEGSKQKEGHQVQIRPNIVLIMTDQHQAQALSCAGNLNIKTPNLDKLAKRGVRSEKADVTFPLCTLSRSSMFTGKMPHN